jgi:hypothetical protein
MGRREQVAEELEAFSIDVLLSKMTAKDALQEISRRCQQGKEPSYWVRALVNQSIRTIRPDGRDPPRVECEELAQALSRLSYAVRFGRVEL